MIDIENEVFTRVATVLRAAYDGIYVSAEYVSRPPAFPAVSIVEMDNYVYRQGGDSQNVENFAEVVYEINVYSSLNRGKKAQCKAIADTIDGVFAEMGFARMMLNQTPNMNDATIYRMTGRYRALVGKDKTIYRR